MVQYANKNFIEFVAFEKDYYSMQSMVLDEMEDDNISNFILDKCCIFYGLISTIHYLIHDAT